MRPVALLHRSYIEVPSRLRHIFCQEFGFCAYNSLSFFEAISRTPMKSCRYPSRLAVALASTAVFTELVVKTGDRVALLGDSMGNF